VRDPAHTAIRHYGQSALSDRPLGQDNDVKFRAQIRGLDSGAASGAAGADHQNIRLNIHLLPPCICGVFSKTDLNQFSRMLRSNKPFLTNCRYFNPKNDTFQERLVEVLRLVEGLRVN
jgi:hypothetical protein